MTPTPRLNEADYITQLRLSRNSPIATADFILVRQEDGKREFLLAKRTEDPWNGEYFVAGGKIIGLDTPEVAAKKNIKRELGIDIGYADLEFVGHLPVDNPEKLGERWYSLWHFYIVHVPNDIEFKLNGENRDAQWFSEIDPLWPEPVQSALLMARFKTRQQ